MILIKYLKEQLNISIKYKKNFLKFSYDKRLYTICKILYIEGYLKNLIYYNSNKCSNILIEFSILNNKIKLQSLKSFNLRLKTSYKHFKDLITFKNDIGLYIINTSKGIKSLKDTLLNRLGGILLLHVI